MNRVILAALLLFANWAFAASKYVYPITLMSAGDMSGNLTSSTLDIMTMDNISVHFIWSGSGAETGSLFIDFSDDGTNWSTPTLAPAPAPAGTDSNALVDLNQLASRYLRCRYTRTSGTGSLKILVGEKGI